MVPLVQIGRCILALAVLALVQCTGDVTSAESNVSSSAGFSWHTFLEMSPDTVRLGVTTLPKVSEGGKINGFSQFNRADMLPCATSIKNAVSRLKDAMKTAPVGKRNLVIYHVEDLELNDHSLEITLNNVKIFVASILHHEASADQSAFYLFNVARVATNPAKALIPADLPNVAIVDWELSPSPMHSFMLTLHQLQHEVPTLVEAVFSLSSGVRGPLVQFQKAAWMDEFRRLLDVKGVGLVGSMISCVGAPHVLTHAFAMRSVLVPQVMLELNRYYAGDEFIPIDEYFRQRLTRATQESNFLISSLFHAKRDKSDVFQNESCKDSATSLLSGCDSNPEDSVFIRWSGENLGARGFLCGKGIAMSDVNRRQIESLTKIVAAAPLKSGKTLPVHLAPKLPELSTGGMYADLYAEYDAEHRREEKAMAALAAKSALEAAKGVKPTPAPLKDGSQVCFLVRTAKMHDPEYVSPKTGKIKYVNMDLEVFARSLIAQMNPNWQAYFIITDPSPFERRLQEILGGFNDSRLVYYDVDMAYRPVVSANDVLFSLCLFSHICFFSTFCLAHSSR